MTSIIQLCDDLYNALNGHAIKDSTVIKLCCSVPQPVLVQVALRYQAMTGCSLEHILTANTTSEYRRILSRLCMKRQHQMLQIVRRHIISIEDKRAEPAAAVLHLALVICTLNTRQLYDLVVAYKQQHFSDLAEDIHEILRRLSLTAPDADSISRIFISLLSCARDDDSFHDYRDSSEKKTQLLAANSQSAAVSLLIELLCGRSVASVRALCGMNIDVEELLATLQYRNHISRLTADIFKIVYYSCSNVNKMWGYICDLAIESKDLNLLADTVLLSYDQCPRLREEYAAIKGTDDVAALQAAINGENPEYEQAVLSALIETGAGLR